MHGTIGVEQQMSREVPKGWLVALGAMIGLSLGLAPVPTYTIGMFAPQLHEAFGWSFAGMMGALTIQSVVIVVMSPVAGVLVDRFGARPVALLSLFAFGLCYMSLALTTGSIWLLYAQWMAMSFAGTGTLSTTWTYVVTGWFDRNRGLALGLVSAGTGFTGLIIKPLTAWLLLTVGWRWSFAIIGLLPIVIGVPVVAALFRERARYVGTPAAMAAEPVDLSGLTLREAMRGRQFWLLFVGFFLISFALSSPTPNIENILRSFGFDLLTIGRITGVFGLAVIAGRLAGGWLLDRIWAPLCVLAVFSLPIAASWVLSQPAIGEGAAFASVAAIGVGAGLEFDALAYLVARYFGRRSYGAIYGSVFSMVAIGGGVGPVIYGYAFDRLGSYALILRVGAVALLAGAGLLLLMGRYPRRLEAD